MYLETIEKANDIKLLQEEELEVLAQEIREFLIESISKTGGHLASNLGVVELTIALHRVLDFPGDKLIFDVGHQSYTHKILTGRKGEFAHLRQFGGMSGFPKRSESDCDAFDTGHSSTSISAGLGYAIARDVLGKDYSIVSVIGDGSMTGGLAYEALNNAANIQKNFIIVLNDNEMSISKNVGGMSYYLDELRTAKAYTGLKNAVETHMNRIPVAGKGMVRSIRKTKNSIKQLLVPGMLFEDMGLKYLGPVDGHDIKSLIRILNDAKRVDGPVVVHVMTKKGNGYEPAMNNPSKFHGTGPFDVETGDSTAKSTKDSWTSVFSKVMTDIGQRDEKVVAITAAMEDGTGLAAFHQRYPERFFDTGIAEEHAVTFAGGLAAAGLKPVFAVYSSFLQRGFDQLVHDICMQKLPVVFALDRAGLVGSDGETHQGVFDLSYLSMIPNMTVLSPKNKWELADMIRFALRLDAPAAVRYPRGEAYDGFKEFRAPIEYGKSEAIYEEDSIALVAVGHMFETATQVRSILKEKGFDCTLINARFVKPFDEQMIRELSKNHRVIATIEENVLAGGFGEHVQEFAQNEHLPVHIVNVALPDEYIVHGSVSELRRENMMDPQSIANRVMNEFLISRS